MTKEELEKEAEEYAIGLFPNDVFKQSAVIQGIIKFTEPREKRIEELEKQIEKMKCCQNCKHCAKIHDYDLDNEEDDNIEFCEVRCHERSGWELKE